MRGNIAAYYSGKGLDAAAIDSHTPASLNADGWWRISRTGRIRVLVNVDVFSEGCDCPDVEFVQMARPTLSLAKYLQQAGRGLRKSTPEGNMCADRQRGALPCVRSAHHGMGLGDVPWGYG